MKIISLIKKDLLLELRQQYTFYGVLLYVASTIFVAYLSMGQPEKDVWNGLFWTIQLFVCVNAVAKSFLQENRGRMLYFYSIAGAKDFVIAKLLFNALLMILMTLLSLFLFTTLLGNPLRNMGYFALITVLGAVGLSWVFTFLASIAAKAQQSAALMTIMGFPVIVPQLLLLMKISKSYFAESAIAADQLPSILLLIGLDVLIALLAIILFPFLWKD